MAIFDLSKNEGVWFDFPGGGRVQLRTLSVGEVVALYRKAIKNTPFVHQEPGKKPIVLNQEVPDPERIALETNDLSIVNWEGFFDANEKPIPCTKEMKTELMGLKDPTFRNFVNEKLATLEEAEKESEKEAEKN